MKKLTFLIASFVLSAALCGCSEQNDASSDAPQENSSSGFSSGIYSDNSSQTSSETSQTDGGAFSEYVKQARDKGAAGVVIRNPREIKNSANMIIDVSPDDPFEEEFLFISAYDGTFVRIFSGELDKFDEELPFTFGESITGFSMKAGDAAKISCSVPELLPKYALMIETGDKTAYYVVMFDGRGEPDSAELISVYS